jgi:hypothetical protein
MDPRLLEHFKEIHNILNNREEPIDIFSISNLFKITVNQAKILLNTFISQGNLLTDFITIFSAEIIFEDKIKTVLVPSYSNKLLEILNLKDNLLSFGVYAILRKEHTGILSDLSLLCHENGLIKNICVNVRENNEKSSNDKVKIENNKTNQIKGNNSTTKDNPLLKNNIPIVKSQGHINKNNQSINKANAKSESSLAKAFNNQIKISKEKKNSFSSDEYGEENYYQSITTKNENGPSISSDLPLASKRKIEPAPSTKSKTKLSKDKKIHSQSPSDSESDYSDLNERKKFANNRGNLCEIQESNENLEDHVKQPNNEEFDIEVNLDAHIDAYVDSKTVENVVMTGNVDSISNESNKNIINSANENLPKKIKKIRRVRKTNTYFDNGYMRTVDEWEDEEYWTDEKVKIIPKEQAQAPVPKKGKKVPQGQGNLLSFFGK